MSYTPPYVGSAGPVINGYQDILAYYLAAFQSIYGNTVALGNDSADFQWISIIALAEADEEAGLQLAYNQQSPATAIGAGLSVLVALNGLARKAASYSTCLVDITGTAGAVITNGVVQDVNGNLWNLPTSFTIGSGGTVTVTATAQQVGAINITAPNQITTIVTPQAGWTSVNNDSNVASIGQPVETDSQLRVRQALSVALPSETLLAGTYAAIAAVPGVTRYNIDENTGSTTNGNGTPGHSIQAVVENGTTLAIATAIFNNKGIGCGTYGTTSQSVTDPNTGVVQTISFDRPTYVPIYVVVNAHNLGGGSLTTAQIDAIQSGIVDYLNNLQIGAVITFGELIQAAANAVNSNPLIPNVSIRSPFYFATTSSPTVNADIDLTFIQAASGSSGNVTVNSV